MHSPLTIFIDEAGDPGVRDGLHYRATRHEWLCLSAVIVSSEIEPSLTEWVREMREAARATQGGSLHYHRIKTDRRTAVCEIFAEKQARAIVLASHKSNLREYINPRIRQMLDAGTFYNFCIRILLERVTAFCEAWFIDRRAGVLGPLEIIFATRGGHDFGAFLGYIDTLKFQAENGKLKLKGPGLAPALLDRSLWRSEPAETRAGLQLADTVASAFYQAANVASPSWDLGPARALKPIMVGATKSRAVNRGVTVWPLADQAPVPEASRAIFHEFGYKF